MKQDKILITGAAGFIGSSLSLSLLKSGKTVIGLDNLANNYNPVFKLANLTELKRFSQFHFHKADILDRSSINQIFHKYRPVTVIHLAALTGVRASLKKPKLYLHVNVTGTINVYEMAINSGVKSFIFSSSSSIYGNNPLPFTENQQPDPLSPYAKSKAQAETEIRKLHSKHNLQTTILRFFSVYGSRGRPDMAPYLFTEAALTGKTVNQFGQGDTARDYTYIDDVLDAVNKTLPFSPGFATINIGDSHPVKLSELIKTVEEFTNRTILKKVKQSKKEESTITYADITKAQRLLKWSPRYSLAKGLHNFIDWYKEERYDPKT